jgi:hypothetical protein
MIRNGLEGSGVRNPVWARETLLSLHHPDRPWDPPSFLYNGYRDSSLEVKRPGRAVDHPSPSSAEVKERVELYLCCPSVPPRANYGVTEANDTKRLKLHKKVQHETIQILHSNAMTVHARYLVGMSDYSTTIGSFEHVEFMLIRNTTLAQFYRQLPVNSCANKR